MGKPIVAIVGRPNVGKSTLFNIFANSRISIVEDTPGVTRDRLYAEGDWLDNQFMMVDTGGIEIMNSDAIAVSIRQQAEIAIKEADVILFVCDARSGIVQEDADVARILRKSGKPIVLAVNKADSPKQELNVYEFIIWVWVSRSRFRRLTIWALATFWTPLWQSFRRIRRACLTTTRTRLRLRLSAARM